MDEFASISSSIMQPTSSSLLPLAGIRVGLSEWLLSRRDRPIVARHEVPG
jgi:hypothetical protein